ncbi:MAG TPA: radical SAM protein [Candidatus Omnitrophota bacterium]|nr:radical SAM protein [Candidatus Omnitrophota bacterium]HPD84095.1 radical SAM protein [Candidatus Omnitrophota bacterium]HRZ02952.1 radical SAM protein [Candidatus Omnitrophota bacterium]
MPKILLINPPCSALYSKLRRISPIYPPLGLLYLASFLEKNNVDVAFYDGLAEGRSVSDVEKILSVSDAEIVGITCTTSTLNEAIQIATYAKHWGKRTFLGGPHVTALPKLTLEKHPCFDVGVIGEGEITLRELIAGKPLNEIDGIVYRHDGEVVMNKAREAIEDLSSLPHPARHHLKNQLYQPGIKEYARANNFFTLITARGCPFQCIFCASKAIWGCRVRERSLEDIFLELEELKGMGMTYLRVLDDTFTLKKSRVREFCKYIKNYNIHWSCNARVDRMDSEIIHMLKDSHCVFVEYGIESGNQKILDIMKKGITLEQIRQAARVTKEAGMRFNCSFIVGNIGETLKTAEETVQLAKELNPDFAQFNMLTPYPGTEVYSICKEKGYLIKDFEDYRNPKYQDPVIALPGLPAKELKKLLMHAYRYFYWRPQAIFKLLYHTIFFK